MSKIDNADIRSPPDSPLQPAIKGGDDGQSIDERNLEDPCSGLEIVEQSKLDHFNAILKEAQRVAVKAEREKSRKRPMISSISGTERGEVWVFSGTTLDHDT